MWKDYVAGAQSVPLTVKYIIVENVVSDDCINVIIWTDSICAPQCS